MHATPKKNIPLHDRVDRHHFIPRATSCVRRPTTYAGLCTHLRGEIQPRASATPNARASTSPGAKPPYPLALTIRRVAADSRPIPSTSAPRPSSGPNTLLSDKCRGGAIAVNGRTNFEGGHQLAATRVWGRERIRHGLTLLLLLLTTRSTSFVGRWQGLVNV